MSSSYESHSKDFQKTNHLQLRYRHKVHKVTPSWNEIHDNLLSFYVSFVAGTSLIDVHYWPIENKIENTLLKLLADLWRVWYLPLFGIFHFLVSECYFFYYDSYYNHCGCSLHEPPELAALSAWLPLVSSPPLVSEERENDSSWAESSYPCSLHKHTQWEHQTP